MVIVSAVLLTPDGFPECFIRNKKIAPEIDFTGGGVCRDTPEGLPLILDRKRNKISIIFPVP